MNVQNRRAVTPRCDIELDFTGPNDATLNNWAADVLRKLANCIENDEFQDRVHPVKDNVGKPVGTISVDYYGELA